MLYVSQLELRFGSKMHGRATACWLISSQALCTLTAMHVLLQMSYAYVFQRITRHIASHGLESVLTMSTVSCATKNACFVCLSATL